MLGTGMYKTKTNFEGYEETDYTFENGKHFKTRLFMQALLECKYKEINQLIILGTDTSSWDCLIDKDNDNRDEIIELWSNLFDQCESKEVGESPKGVSRDNLDSLEKYLSERFSIEVLIKEHTHLIDNNTAKELFECYTEATNLVKKGNDILFDITHGFRSMPVLLYQSLQYSLSQTGNRSLDIVYGELFINDKSKGHVRNLSNYWNYSELSIALNVFNTKLDGFKLAELIEPYWSLGSKAIKRFSEIVQTNFSLQICDVIPQIRNALDKYPKDAPKWLESIKPVLEKICKLVDNNSIAKTLYNYSVFFFEHKLNVQAIITLQVAVETSIVEKFGKPDYIGDYNWWHDKGHDYLDNLKSENFKELRIPLSNLEGFRNQVAHGGGKNRGGNSPSAASIPSIYKDGKRGVENLFKILEI
jgi:CRISPR-associated Csx2 family protein